MASKVNVTFNILLVSGVIVLGNVISRLLPVGKQTKYSLGYPVESTLNFTEITRLNGYISQEHTVVTKDGYILTMFRIVKARNCKGKLISPPVILMHGLLQSSDAWLDAGTDAGLAYLLSDACYDLWVGNQRGNNYGRRHVRLNPDKDAQFWQFSVDEIGLYDIPATIDYVLQHTGFKKLNYIGYSQGSGTFFIMCSERPEYCDKVKILIGLAPASRQTHTKSIPYRIFAESTNGLEPVLSAVGVHEILAKGAPSQEFLAFFCQLGQVTDVICDKGKVFIDSYHPGSITNETIRVMFGHFPAGTSVHNMAKYGQSMQSDKFRKFDYGKRRNLKLYGTTEPPSFNLSAVTCPVMALYGRSDYLVDPKDIAWLVENIPNMEAIEVKDPQWNHLDVTYSQYTREMIFPTINEYLLKYSTTQ